MYIPEHFFFLFYRSHSLFHFRGQLRRLLPSTAATYAFTYHLPAPGNCRHVDFRHYWPWSTDALWKKHEAHFLRVVGELLQFQWPWPSFYSCATTESHHLHFVMQSIPSWFARTHFHNLSSTVQVGYRGMRPSAIVNINISFKDRRSRLSFGAGFGNFARQHDINDRDHLRFVLVGNSCFDVTHVAKNGGPDSRSLLEGGGNNETWFE